MVFGAFCSGFSPETRSWRLSSWDMTRKSVPGGPKIRDGVVFEMSGLQFCRSGLRLL